MDKKERHLGLALIFFSTLLGADPSSDASIKRAQLAEQKAKLVGALVNTPAFRSASTSNNPQVAALAASSLLQLEQAQADLKAARTEIAIEKLDDALRDLSRASSMLTGESRGQAAQKLQFDERAVQIDSYRRALQDMTKTPQTAVKAQSLIAKIDELTGEGRRLMANGKTDEANSRMATAYKLAVEEISRMRDGQEVIMRLQFNSPREEFDYEQKRFHSNEILVGMMSREERTSPETRQQVTAFFENAMSLKNEANSMARANDYPAAVKEMEKAIIQLNKALQIMGVPIF